MRPADANRLIVDAALGAQTLSAGDLDSVVEHVARAGFDSSARERARGELAGMVWRGTVLRGSDRLPPAERHYLKHVVRRREWPSGTSLGDYLRSLSEIIRDPTSGVFTSLYHGEPQLGVVRETRNLRGPDGHDWVVIDYRVVLGHWITAYQPAAGLPDLEGPSRTAVRWWREPR